MTSTIEEKLKEIEALRNSIGFQGITQEKVTWLMVACVDLEAMLRRCRAQRNSIHREDCNLPKGCEEKWDAELLELVEGRKHEG